MLIIGPPGTAKSMLADELCRRIEGANYFQWLLTKFSTPEEIFGAVSLSGLEHDDYRRVTSHKLPEAHIAFLDEIFKANSSILNALLTIINERIFHNGRERVRVPLITMFGASNELPDEDELTALYDRFMLRFMVDYIIEEFRFLKMLEGRVRAARTTLSFAELDELRAQPARSNFRAACSARSPSSAASSDASKSSFRIGAGATRSTCCARTPSFPAARSSPRTISASSSTCCGRIPEEQPKVRDAIHRLVKGYEEQAQELVIQSQELREYAERRWESDELRSRALIEAHTKIANILVRFDHLVREAAESGRTVHGVETMRSQVKDIQQSMLRRI